MTKNLEVGASFGIQGTFQMIAPITGKFRKLFIKDLTIALSLGGAGGAAWWNLYHLPNVARRDAYYAKLEASKSQ
ncbi:hypothetical protein BX666DRAFT_2027589 [Dichotomocladium elegans]|nr:hypothetical protein BX666DRAFT_2027589 [Dichotomocladium elegans]